MKYKYLNILLNIFKKKTPEIDKKYVHEPRVYLPQLDGDLPANIEWIFEYGNICKCDAGYICPDRLNAILNHLEQEGKILRYKTEKTF